MYEIRAHITPMVNCILAFQVSAISVCHAWTFFSYLLFEFQKEVPFFNSRNSKPFS